jgi:hypothetical protein
MPIITSKSQNDRELTEFYSAAAQETDFTSREICKAMLEWIKRIELELPDLEIWGLTSHYRLVLMSTDTFEGDWSVIIIGQQGNFKVDYLIPKENAPWTNAYVTGETTDFEEALKMSLIGIKNSGAWKKNSV